MPPWFTYPVARYYTPIIVSLIIVIVIGNYVYSIYTDRSQITAKILITPQEQSLNLSPLTIQAKLGQTSIDLSTRTIPALQFSSSLITSSQQAMTTQSCDQFWGITLPWTCKSTVLQTDVDKLKRQVQLDVDSQVHRKLQQQEQGQDIMLAGNLSCTNDPTVNPAVGVVSDIVTVTYSSECIQEYIKNADIITFISQMLQDKLEPNRIFSAIPCIYPPQYNGTDKQGTVSLTVTATSVTRYIMSPHAVSNITSSVAGKSKAEARKFIVGYIKINPNDVQIDINIGSTLPENREHITVIPREPSKSSSIQCAPITK